MAETRPVRVRFAPSPTGPLHIGGARTALYNFLVARSLGGVFVLRVDDTDPARSTDEGLQSILEGLRWLGLHWDEGPEKGGAFGPYFQGQRLQGYRRRAGELLRSGHAYACFCTPEEVKEGRERMRLETGNPMYDRRCRSLDPEEARRRAGRGEGHTLRFKIPEGRVTIRDVIKGEVTIDLSGIDDWVMLREDGSPLYNLCSALDDIDMEISHVIRGEEHFMNAVKQSLLYRALGAELPVFAHLPLILGKDGKKLSKRIAQTDLLDYRRRGHPPEAMVNFFTRLGWGFDAERDIFTLEESIERFRLEHVGKSGSILDEEKLLHICGVYVRRMSREELLEAVLPHLVKAGLATREQVEEERPWFCNLVACFQERIRVYSELPPKLGCFFSEGVDYDEKAWKVLTKRGETAGLLRDYLGSLLKLPLPPSPPDRPAEADLLVKLPSGEDAADDVPFLPPIRIEDGARAFAEEKGVGFGRLVHPLRAALTGTTKGPGLFDVLYLLGRERAEARILAAASALQA